MIRKIYNSIMHRAYKILRPSDVFIGDLFTDQPSKSYHLVTAVRYLFIESLFEKDESKRLLYKRAIHTDLRNGKDEENFNALIESIEVKGFKKNSAILMDKDGNVIDGTHRLATSIYLGKERIYARIIPRRLNPLTLSERIKLFDLPEKDLVILYQTYERMIKKIHER